MIKEGIDRGGNYDKDEGNMNISFKELKKSLISFDNFKEVFDRKFHHSLFTKDLSKTGLFNALVFITFSINFTQFTISEFHGSMGLMPMICIILITGLCSFYIQSSIVPYIRNVKNKQGSYSAFINQHFGSFASILFDLLVFVWFAFDIMYALFNILHFIPALDSSGCYYMYIWLTPLICLILVFHHRLTCSCFVYFNIYFALLLNCIYLIIAIVFLGLQAFYNDSYFDGAKINWNFSFAQMNVYMCFQAFSVFSFGLSNAMLVFWVVNQYSGIAFSNRRYYQMGFIYVFVVVYFMALGSLDFFLNELDLMNMNEKADKEKFWLWIWIFRGIYFLQQLTQLSYMFWFLRRSIIREDISLLLQQKKYYYSLYSIFLFLLAGISILFQKKVVKGLSFFQPKTYSLISNGIIGFMLNFFLPILIYIKFSEKRLGSFRMISKVILCFIFSLFALSFFYYNLSLE